MEVPGLGLRKRLVAAMVGVLLAASTVIAFGLATQSTLETPQTTPQTEAPLDESLDPSPTPARVFRLYLSPAGSDKNSGRTLEDALASLSGVQEALKADPPPGDVEVRIALGTYVAAQTTWHFYIPGHFISFMPVDYEYGDGVEGVAGRPVFRSNGRSGWWFSARLPSGHPGGRTNLRFYYLKVERYSSGGLAISGGTAINRLGVRVPSGAGANGNTVIGMMFRQLGSRHSAAGFGYGAVDLVNSSDNRIEYNHFRRLENTGRTTGLIHGVYLAHWSKRNLVTKNRFSYISGGAIHARNDSNDNEIFANKFERSGTAAAYYDWFCDSACVRDNPNQARECPSHGNIFRNNDIVSAYRGGPLASWGLKAPGVDNVGGPGCDNEGKKRLRTSGNT
jgi:hypothetical protein